MEVGCEMEEQPGAVGRWKTCSQCTACTTHLGTLDGAVEDEHRAVCLGLRSLPLRLRRGASSGLDFLCRRGSSPRRREQPRCCGHPRVANVRRNATQSWAQMPQR